MVHGPSANNKHETEKISHKKEDVYFQRYERGKIVTDLQKIGKSDVKGTEVRFKADPEIFKETTVYDYSVLERRLREQAFLNAGVHIELRDERDLENIMENLDNVNFNMEIFKAFAKGYLESAKVFLLPIEVENLPYAAALFPYMQCVRFLADYINGDTYYKTKYPEHNLVRTKAQFKLLQSVEEHTPEMQEFIKSSLV